ncbi:GNAT family N-acetyltransferase [Halobacterium litoreum]|uniref:GNAT family N-acetyltransferase n=1 Tax=Halobacterium litoreum TaxID=2039234 RepID=A0ABD5NF48_9EURY|nr:hypothetical protein [Halobacterium litoreum]UHH13271.1 hypothetical protein LT972_14070 [Halobacterium litoreum]
MHVRDATDEDADAVVALADEAVDAARLIRDRSVRVADDDGEVAGFVAYDTWRGAVHVTRLGGDPAALGDLLAAPCEFAAREDLPVEVVLPDDEDDDFRTILDDEGFEDAGAGPMFDGRRTRRYRRQP